MAKNLGTLSVTLKANSEQFNKAIADAKKIIRTLGTTLNEQSAQFSKFSKDIVGITKSLQEQLRFTRNSFKALNREVTNLSKGTSGFTQPLKEVQKGLRNTRNSVDRTAKSIRNLGKNEKTLGADLKNNTNRTLGNTKGKLDDLSRSLKETGGNSTKTGKSFDNTSKSGGGLLQRITGLTLSFKKFAARIFTINILWKSWNATLRLVKDTLSEIIHFDQGLKNIQAITVASVKDILKIGIAIRSLAIRSPFSPSQLAEAFTLLGQAGFSASEGIATIKSVAALSIASLTDLTEVVKLLTTTLRAFDLQANASADVTNILVAAVNNSKLTIEGLNTALNFAGPAAAGAGLSVSQLAAALGVLANNGIRASTQGTGVRQLLSALIAPSTKLRRELDKINLSVDDVNPLLHDFGDILQLLNERGFNASQAFAGLNRRTANIAQALISGAKEFDRLSTSITGTQAALLAMQTQMTGAEQTLQRLRQAFLATFNSAASQRLLSGFLSILEAFLLSLNSLFFGLANVITGVFDSLNSGAFIVLDTFGNLTGILRTFNDVILNIISVAPILTAALITIGIGLSTSLGTIGLITAFLASLTIATLLNNVSDISNEFSIVTEEADKLTTALNSLEHEAQLTGRTIKEVLVQGPSLQTILDQATSVPSLKEFKNIVDASFDSLTRFFKVLKGAPLARAQELGSLTKDFKLLRNSIENVNDAQKALSEAKAAGEFNKQALAANQLKDAYTRLRVTLSSLGIDEAILPQIALLGIANKKLGETSTEIDKIASKQTAVLDLIATKITNLRNSLAQSELLGISKIEIAQKRDQLDQLVELQKLFSNSVSITAQATRLLNTTLKDYAKNLRDTSVKSKDLNTTTLDLVRQYKEFGDKIAVVTAKLKLLNAVKGDASQQVIDKLNTDLVDLTARQIAVGKVLDTLDAERARRAELEFQSAQDITKAFISQRDVLESQLRLIRKKAAAEQESIKLEAQFNPTKRLSASLDVIRSQIRSLKEQQSVEDKILRIETQARKDLQAKLKSNDANKQAIIKQIKELDKEIKQHDIINKTLSTSLATQERLLELTNSTALAWNNVADTLETGVSQGLADILTQGTSLKNVFKSIGSDLKTSINKALADTIKKKIAPGGFDELFKGNIFELGGFVKDILSGNFKAAFSDALKGLDGLASAAGKIFSGLTGNGGASGGSSGGGIFGGGGSFASALPKSGAARAGITNTLDGSAPGGGGGGGLGSGLFGSELAIGFSVASAVNSKASTVSKLIQSGISAGISTALVGTAFVTGIINGVATGVVSAAAAVGAGATVQVALFNLAAALSETIIGAIIALIIAAIFQFIGFGSGPGASRLFQKRANEALKTALPAAGVGGRLRAKSGKDTGAALRPFGPGDAASTTANLVDAFVVRNGAARKSIESLRDVLLAVNVVLSDGKAISLGISATNNELLQILNSGESLKNLNLNKLFELVGANIGTFGGSLKKLNESLKTFEDTGLNPDQAAAFEGAIRGLTAIFSGSFPKGVDVSRRALELFASTGKVDIKDLKDGITSLLEDVAKSTSDLTSKPLKIVLDTGSLSDAFDALKTNFDKFVQDSVVGALTAALASAVVNSGILTVFKEAINGLLADVSQSDKPLADFDTRLNAILSDSLPKFEELRKVFEAFFQATAGVLGLPLEKFPDLFGTGESFLRFSKDATTATDNFLTAFNDFNVGVDKINTVIDNSAFLTNAPDVLGAAITERIVLNQKEAAQEKIITDRILLVINSNFYVGAINRINRATLKDAVIALLSGETVVDTAKGNLGGNIFMRGSIKEGVTLSQGQSFVDIATTTFSFKRVKDFKKLQEDTAIQQDIIDATTTNLADTLRVDAAKLDEAFTSLFATDSISTLSPEELKTKLETFFGPLSDETAKQLEDLFNELKKAKRKIPKLLADLADAITNPKSFEAFFSSLKQSFAEGLISSKQFSSDLTTGLQSLQDTLPNVIDVTAIFNEALDENGNLIVDKFDKILTAQLDSVKAFSSAIKSTLLEALKSGDVNKALDNFKNTFKRSIGDALLEAIIQSITNSLFITTLGPLFEKIGSLLSDAVNGKVSLSDIDAFIKKNVTPVIKNVADISDSVLGPLLEEVIKIFTDSGLIAPFQNIADQQDKTVQAMLDVALKWQDIVQQIRDVRNTIQGGASSPLNALAQIEDAKKTLAEQLSIFRNTGLNDATRQKAAEDIVSNIKNIFDLGGQAGDLGASQFQKGSLSFQKFSNDLLGILNEVEITAAAKASQVEVLQNQLEVLQLIAKNTDPNIQIPDTTAQLGTPPIVGSVSEPVPVDIVSRDASQPSDIQQIIDAITAQGTNFIQNSQFTDFLSILQNATIDNATKFSDLTSIITVLTQAQTSNISLMADLLTKLAPVDGKSTNDILVSFANEFNISGDTSNGTKLSDDIIEELRREIEFGRLRTTIKEAL